MCFFSSPKPPPTPIAPPPPPTPAPPPTPTITPSNVSPQEQAEGRRRKLERLRYGLSSTIKTSARGITGSGADLQSPATGKVKLGA